MQLMKNWLNHVVFSCNKTPIEVINAPLGEVIIYGHIYKGRKELVSYLMAGNFEDIQRWLPSCDGSFSVLIYEKSKYLHFFSDKWATKPFYFCPSERKISDRLKNVLPKFPKLNRLAAAEFLAFYGFIQGDKTLVNNVIKTQPATWYRVSLVDQNIERKQYWKPEFSYTALTPKEKTAANLSKAWIDTFGDICRWIGERKVVCPISAGLDSRAILSELARRGLQNQVTTVTFSLPGRFELKVAKEVAKELGFKHVHLLIEESDLQNETLFSNTAEAHDYQIWNTPYVSPNLHKKMADFGDILISGFGGDPLMGSHMAHGDQSLGEYLIDKYSWLHQEEINALSYLQKTNISSDLLKEASKFDTGHLLEDYDAWYLFQRNTNMTQHSIMGHRDCYEIVLPFMDSRVVDAISNMSPDGRKQRNLFHDVMKDLYPSAFKLKSSADRGWFFDLFYKIERVIGLVSRQLLGKAIVNNSFDYKPDMNESYRRDPVFRRIVTENAELLVELGLIEKGFLEKIKKSLLSGLRDGKHGQQRFPVMCAMSSLSVNLSELGIKDG